MSYNRIGVFKFDWKVNKLNTYIQNVTWIKHVVIMPMRSVYSLYCERETILNSSGSTSILQVGIC